MTTPPGPRPSPDLQALARVVLGIADETDAARVIAIAGPRRTPGHPPPPTPPPTCLTDVLQRST